MVPQWSVFRTGEDIKISGSGGFFVKADAVLFEAPKGANDQAAFVVHERGFFAFENMSNELETPTDGKHRRGQGQTDDGRTDGETEGNERNADFMACLVSRVAMIILVFVQEASP
jgi:hypothetical protein